MAKQKPIGYMVAYSFDGYYIPYKVESTDRQPADLLETCDDDDMSATIFATRKEARDAIKHTDLYYRSLEIDADKPKDQIIVPVYAHGGDDA